MMRARRVWVQIHLWLGLTFGVIGAVLGLSGSALTYDHALDTWLHPARYAVSGSQVSQPFAEYVKSAQASVGDARVFAVRMPDGEDRPVTAILRGDGRMKRVYLDPPTARVLDVGSANDLVAWLHQFHESLNLREYGGRAIVGCVGVGMLISSLTGLYLWWPANGVRRTGVGFRHGFALTRNLHYTLGFFGCLVLATLSFTGVALAFPDTARSLVGSAAPRVSVTAESADDAVAIARRDHPGGRITVIALPQTDGGAYRVSFAASKRDGYSWMRVLHEGSAFGGVYRFVVFLGGLLPAVLAVTGFVMWLPTRRAQPRASLHVPAVARDDRLPG